MAEQIRKETTQVDENREIVVPDGHLRFDLKPLLSVVEDIINRGIPTLAGNANVTQAQAQAQMEASNKVIFNVASEELKMIRTISCEICCNCSDVNTTTEAVFEKLSSYSWDAKLVTALASFAVNYSEFCLAAQLYQSNPFAKFLGLLKQLQSKLESAAKSWKSEFEKLIKATMDVTKCIQELKQISPEYLTRDMPPFSNARSYASQAICSAIRSIVICAKIISIEPDSQTSEVGELSSLASRVSNIHEKLSKERILCNEYIGEYIARETALKEYMEFGREFEKLQVNVEIVNALINTKDPPPLFHRSSSEPVSVEVLKGKEVLLLISDLYISNLVLSNLVRFDEVSRKDTAIQYEVVWVPVAEYSSSTLGDNEKKFKAIRGSMPWYSLRDLSIVKKVAVTYIKKKWNFNKEPLFVRLSPSGGVAAAEIYSISKVYAWERGIFPPKILPPAENTWNIKLLAGNLISSSTIKDGSYICFYGGEDKEWIRSFTTKAKKVAEAANIQLELVYVGQSNSEKYRKKREIINAEKLSETLSEEDMDLFWGRLKGLWQDKVEQGKTRKEDPITWKLMRILHCFDGSHQGWAVFSEGLVNINNMAEAKGDIIVKCLDLFDSKKADLKKTNFVSALNGYINELLDAHHCVPMVLPSTITNIPEKVLCPECLSPMERFNMFRCCPEKN